LSGAELNFVYSFIISYKLLCSTPLMASAVEYNFIALKMEHLNAALHM